MHNYFHDKTKLPTVFSTYLVENSLIHNQNTWQKTIFIHT